MKALRGVIRGKTIELLESPGLPDGTEVEVQIRPVVCASRRGEGPAGWIGALADSWTPEDDQILEELGRDRQRSTRDLPE